MRDALNLSFLPIVEDEMHGIQVRASANTGFSNISNGYYGYQPLQANHEDRSQKCEQMETQVCDMEIQFANNNESNHRKLYPPFMCRKRAWEYNSDPHHFKKRRENEPDPIIPVLPASNKIVSFRHPTHNMPDISRCMMASECNENWRTKKETKLETANKERRQILEELLKETHGCNWYHWSCDEL